MPPKKQKTPTTGKGQQPAKVTRLRLASESSSSSPVPISKEPNLVVVADDDNKLQCYACDSNFSAASVNVNQTMFSSIQQLATIGVRWHCPSCLGNPVKTTSLQHEMDEFKTIMKDKLLSITDRFDKQLESFQTSIMTKFDKFHQSSDKVEETISNYANAVSKNLDVNQKTNQVMADLALKVENIKQNVETDLDEKSERKLKERKSKNVILFKLPESEHGTPAEIYQQDFNKVISTIDSTNSLGPSDVEELFRLGEKDLSTAPRPVLIRFNSIETRNRILRARNLRYRKSKTESENDKNAEDDKEEDEEDGDGDDKKEDGIPVFLAPDRTKKEQEAHKKLVKELKKRKDEGEVNLIIRNGKVIPKEPFRFRPQTCWGSRVSSE